MVAPGSPSTPRRPVYDDDLRLALVMADDADGVTMDHFGGGLRVETKADSTPVTEADRRVEHTLRSMLRRARPRDAVHGEELEDTGHGPRRWVLDPIDGTRNYVRGVPVWATLIALMDGPEVVAGVVSAPALGRRWWAARGSGAWTGRSLSAARRCTVSSVPRLEEASVSYSSVISWADIDRLRPFADVLRTAAHTRAFGDFWSYMLVAEGGVDVAAEPELALHDLAAPQVIVTEAGGRFTDLRGRPGARDGSALATNGLLHDELLRRLG